MVCFGIVAIGHFSTLTTQSLSAQQPACDLVRVIDTSLLVPPSPDPSGIAYLPASQSLLVSDSEVNETDIFLGSNLFALSLTGGLVGTASTIAYSTEPTGLAIRPDDGTVFVSDDNADQIYHIRPGPDGVLLTDDDEVKSWSTEPFGVDDPEDLAFDAVSGHLFVVEGLDSKVFRISPGDNGEFDGVSPGGDDVVVSSFETRFLGLTDPEGIALDPRTGNLLLVGRPAGIVLEATPSGELVRVFDTSVADATKPSGILLAPGSSNPEDLHLYITDRGIDNDVDPNENDGKIFEFCLEMLPGNFAPSVDVGPDREITLSETVQLSGSVSDDGVPNPPGATVVTWSHVSGPGTVTFGDVHALETSASFSIAGAYVLRLSSDDGGLVGNDDLSVVVSGTLGERVLDVRISDGNDDGEEFSTGAVRLRSSDLEIVFDGGVNQVIGLHFRSVNLPSDAVVSNAYIQFVSDEAGKSVASLNIRGERIADSPPIENSEFNISSRLSTEATVAWLPPPWIRVPNAGIPQRTSNIAPVLNEIVAQLGWQFGNALTLIITGSGQRVAAAFNKGADVAPLLHIEYFSESAPPLFRRSDPNGDGKIDIRDAIFILTFLFIPNSGKPTCMSAADTNDELGIEISDAVYALNYLFSVGPSPPAPFRSCGSDPTPDALGCEFYDCSL